MVAMANKGPNLNAQAFFITLTDSHLPDLDGKHSVIGQVVEGLEVLDQVNDQIVDDKSSRPLKNLRIKHSIVIDDPFPDPDGFKEPSRSPSPARLRLEHRKLKQKPEDEDNFLDEEDEQQLKDIQNKSEQALKQDME